MRTYATLISGAVAGLDDPLERLAGAVIASARMPALHGRAGVDRGLSHLRRQLAQAEPELVARSQEPVTALYHGLVEEAMAGSTAAVVDVEIATYFLSALRTGLILSMTWGDEYGVGLPDAIELSCFSLAGLGLARPRSWHEEVDAKLELSGADRRSILRRLANEPARTRR